MTETMGIYTIYDKTAGTYGPIMKHENELVAVRTFKQATRGMHDDDKKDYELRYIGQFSNVTGTLIPADAPKPVMGYEYEEKNLGGK
jgi:hypothetical protein